jgi:serine/threonine protein kinase
VRPGQTVDRWKLVRFLGRGGSAEVWAAEGAAEGEIALKILNSKGRYEGRFLDEIKLYKQLGDRSGILQLVDSHIPDEAPGRRRTPPWMAMEIGTLITAYLGPNPNLSAVVESVRSFAGTLARLAEDGIHHRDIKPPNLYWARGEFRIGDFGIADFPAKSGLTRTGERIGPANFLAPEMIESSGNVPSAPADVYSLAKTLWALAARQTYPPPGELRRDRPELQLSSFAEDPQAVMLESLLEQATSHDPSRRPTMAQIEQELAWWSARETPISPDLAGYVKDVDRLRAATTLVKPETEEERFQRFRSEAQSKVYEGLTLRLADAFKSAGLQTINRDKQLEGWVRSGYGGGGTQPQWGIETLESPWVAAFAGVLHRVHPEIDFEDMAVTFVLAEMAPYSQDNYVERFEKFRLGSLQLDRIVEAVWCDAADELPSIVARFLSNCGTRGVPR